MNLSLGSTLQVWYMEVSSEWVNVVEVWKHASNVTEHEFLICFVDESTEPQNFGRNFDSAAPVLNFAPRPSSVHMFGGTVVDTATRKVRKVSPCHLFC